MIVTMALFHKTPRDPLNMFFNLIGVSKNTGHIWQELGDEERYDDVLPKFADSRRYKFSNRQKKDLKLPLKMVR